jgi:hypothetical protein
MRPLGPFEGYLPGVDKQVWMPVSGALFAGQLVAVSLVHTGTHPA